MKNVSKFLLVSLVTVALAGCSSSDKKEEKGELTILYTNDVHAGIEDNIGYVALAKYRKDLISKGKEVLLVDAGDHTQGAPIATFSNGAYLIDIMNSVGYDLATPGNHEFDYGADYFLDNLKSRANYEYISSTFLKVKDKTTVLNPYKVVEKGGYKLGFIGVSTPETIKDGNPKNFIDEDGNYKYTFMESEPINEFYKKVQDTIDEVNKQNVDYTIILGHLGIDGDYSSDKLVKNISGVDFVIDAHSHSTVNYNEVLDKEGEPVVITQTGTKLEHVGEVTINKKGAFFRLHDNTDLTQKDEIVDKQIQDFNKKIEEKTSEIVGHSEYDLVIKNQETGERLVRKQETNLGDFCADAFLAYGGSDIALVNGGGVRVDLLKGDITVGKLMNVHPFANDFATIKAKGQMILDYLENGVKSYPNEDGFFAIPAGLKYVVNPNIPSPVITEGGSFVRIEGERRVTSASINGVAIDPNKKYTVSGTTYFLKECADASVVFKDAEIIVHDSIPDYQVLIKYLKETLNGEIPSKYSLDNLEGRIMFAD